MINTFFALYLTCPFFFWNTRKASAKRSSIFLYNHVKKNFDWAQGFQNKITRDTHSSADFWEFKPRPGAGDISVNMSQKNSQVQGPRAKSSGSAFPKQFLRNSNPDLVRVISL